MRWALGFVGLGNILEDCDWGEDSRDFETIPPADVTPRRSRDGRQVTPGRLSPVKTPGKLTPAPAHVSSVH